MHYVVVGAGAVGCYVGGALAQAGCHVSFVGRPRVVEALLAQGLRVSDLDGRDAMVAPGAFAAVTAVRDLALVAGEPLLVLLCVKGGATSAAAAELAAALPAGTPVLSLQNGVENVERVRATAPDLLALAGMVPFNVIQPAPGQVHRATSGALRAGRHAVTRSALPDFEKAGLPLRLEADMRAVQWGKLLLNLNNPVNALADLPLRDELQQRDYRRVLAALIEEALGALRAARITPAKVSASPPRLLPTILRLPDWAFRVVAARMLQVDASARSSMWDDIQAGRKTEIDDLCGAVVRLGAAHAVPTPLNAQMRTLIELHTRGHRYGAPQLRLACGLRR